MHFSFLLGLTLRRINHIFSICDAIEKEEKQSREYFLMYSDVKEPFDTLSIHTA